MVDMHRGNLLVRLGALLAAVLLTTVTMGVPPAQASAQDCYSQQYACTPGYTGDNAAGTWAWRYYGGGWAQTSNGYHNCTLYVAWRLSRNGMNDPGRTWGFAKDWAATIGGGNSTPAVGSVAWWPRGDGHVAYVEEVSGSRVFIRADNFFDPGYTTSGWIEASTVPLFLHPHDVAGGGGTAPGRPGPIAALPHGSRVDLSWNTAEGAAEYQVMRNGVHLSTVTSSTFLDMQVSPGQAYSYTVVARNGIGSTAGPSRYVQTTGAAGDRAYLGSKWGPALCGRAGDQNSQLLVCSIRRSTGWTSSYSPPGDWGYAGDRAWLVNTDGTISYCRRVGEGDQVRCDRYDGRRWTSATSPRADLAYHENRAYLSTKDGPALCGRAGDQNSQSLVCNVLKSTGWVVDKYSRPSDWGYDTDRAWLVGADKTVSYCRRVGDGSQALCDRFNGTTWYSSMSPRFDLGYAENRTYLASKWGPAICGRAGDQNAQFLVCSVRRSTGWTTSYSPATSADWGYPSDRSWLVNADGTISYCRRVGEGDQVRCDRYTGSRWTSATSTPSDLGYHDNRAYLSTKDGPAVCGRAGDESSQFLVCAVLKSTGWVTNRYSPPGDWGYATDRAWLVGADKTVSYCRRVGDGSQARCDRFNGTTWYSSTSPRYDLGYPDTF